MLASRDLLGVMACGLGGAGNPAHAPSPPDRDAGEGNAAQAPPPPPLGSADPDAGKPLGVGGKSSESEVGILLCTFEVTLLD